MNAKDIENELLEQGIDTNGIVAIPESGVYYAVGRDGSQLPSINGLDPVPDPSLDSE